MNKKILLVVSSYYKDISKNLISGSTNFLNENNFEYDISDVPGAFEIPFVIKKNINKYLGFIALGCLIRGETYHFEIISNETSRKIIDLSVDYEKPIGLGLLTCETYEQAIIRSDPLQKKKGKEAAFACCSLVNLRNE